MQYIVGLLGLCVIYNLHHVELLVIIFASALCLRNPL